MYRHSMQHDDTSHNESVDADERLPSKFYVQIETMDSKENM